MKRINETAAYVSPEMEVLTIEIESPVLDTSSVGSSTDPFEDGGVIPF